MYGCMNFGRGERLHVE